MDSLHLKHGRKKYSGVADTAIDTTVPGQRPPVEGRDSLTGKKGRKEDRLSKPSNRPATPLTGRTPTTPDMQNANYIPMTQTKGRPEVKPLPLRSVERPDGQSPEAQPGDLNANTPSSFEMSPILQKTQLFPDSQSHTLSVFAAVAADDDEYEYDDYVPNLPGSYYTMDPTACTLTWSQQPPWAQKQLQHNGSGRSASQASVDPASHSRGSLC